MSDSDRESTDDDLIREILDLRPNQDPGDSALQAPAAQIECDDPFGTPEPSSAPVVSKKRNRRLRDSDEDEDDNDDVLLKVNAVVDERKHPSASQDEVDKQIDHSEVSTDLPGSAQPSQLRRQKRRPVISDDSEDDDVALKAAAARDGKQGCSTPQRSQVLQQISRRKRPVISDDSDGEDIVLKAARHHDGNNDSPAAQKNYGKSENDIPHRSSPLQQISSRKRRPVISDSSDDDIGGTRLDDDASKNKVSHICKRRRPIVDGSDDDGEPKGKSDLASWQSEGEGSAHVKSKAISSVGKSPEPEAPGSDSDESDLDKVILKKHCSVAGRRSKYGSKPNPDFLDDLLKRICIRSRQIGLESEGSKSDSPPKLSEPGASNDKTDNDSIELEFSDDEERQAYNQQFQPQLGNPSGLVQT